MFVPPEDLPLVCKVRWAFAGVPYATIGPFEEFSQLDTSLDRLIAHIARVPDKHVWVQVCAKDLWVVLMPFIKAGLQIQQ